MASWRGMRPGGRVAKLTARKRSKLKKRQFGLPGSKKYPLQDKRHAANAKARATQQRKKGNISKSTEAKIKARANKVLRKGKKKGNK